MICFHPSITIQINKNAKNPHAILRSELEHARDIAKREVPNQKEKHFSRYSGKNESEMSLGYVKKKADSRTLKNKTEAKIEADNTKYNYDVQKGNDPSLVTSEGLSEYTSITIRTKDDKPLGHIRFHDMGGNTFFVDMMENYKKSGGFVRTAIAKVLKDNPNKKVHWQAISDESVKSYKKFCEEYPDFVERVEFEDIRDYIDVDKLFDELVNPIYNSEKGVIDGKRNNQGFNGRKSQSGVQNESDTSNFKISKEMEGGTVTTGNNYNTSRGVPESLSTTNERGINTSNNNSRPISERLTSTDGDLDQIEKVVAEVVAKDTDLSGTTWEALAKDADSLFDKLEEYGVTGIDNLKKAFNQGQIDVINTATRYALAAERMVGNLREQAAAIMKQGGDITEIAEALALYIVRRKVHRKSSQKNAQKKLQ